MRKSMQSATKMIVVLLMAVVLGVGLMWIYASAQHAEWARPAWRLIWFVFVPALILFGAWTLQNSRVTAEKNQDTEN